MKNAFNLILITIVTLASFVIADEPKTIPRDEARSRPSTELKTLSPDEWLLVADQLAKYDKEFKDAMKVPDGLPYLIMEELPGQRD